nr:lysophospholipid acyltransferase family protein [Rhizomicrobium palustre]
MAVLFLGLTLLSAPIQWLAIKLRLPLQRTYPHAYHRFLCRLFGIKIHVRGEPVRGQGVLIVANHTSYFDILVMSATLPVSFVAKSEVSSWPLFGLMSKLQRSVFVDRSKRAEAVKSAEQIRQRLKDGDTLVLFPEGTTSDGNHVLPFKSALMGSVESDIGRDGHVEYVPVQPVSISYVGYYGIPLGRENRPFFAWYGDMELVEHVLEAFKTGPLDVVVEFHKPLRVSPECGRKQLAAQAESTIREGQIKALRGEWGMVQPLVQAAE